LSVITEIGRLGLELQIQDQHSIVIQVHSDSEESETNYYSLQVDFPHTSNVAENVHLNMHQETVNSESTPNVPSQQGNRDGNYIRLDNFIKHLFEMNEKLNLVIWQQFMVIGQEVFPESFILDNTFKIKGMKDINEDLHKIVKNFIEAGFQAETCCNIYNIFRIEFLNKCLYRLELQEFNLCDVENENIGSSINAFNTALMTLLPNERVIWHRVFSGFSLKYSLFTSSEWKRMEIELWNKFMEFEARTHYNSTQEGFVGCGVHPHTRGVMNCIKNVSEDSNNTTYFPIPSIIQLLESNLDTKSKNYKNNALRYLFMLNNTRYIQLIARYDPLQLLTILGEDWIQIQTSKVRRHIRHFLKWSWNKLVSLMNNNKSMAPKVAIKSMCLFHLHFYDICVAQSESFVVDEWLKEVMRLSVKRMILPLYENFIGRIKDVLGKDDVDRYVKYGVIDVEIQLDCLFRQNHPIKLPPSTSGHCSC
jgi:hypothetical protein